jgi:hypothetical protein
MVHHLIGLLFRLYYYFQCPILTGSLLSAPISLSRWHLHHHLPWLSQRSTLLGCTFHKCRTFHLLPLLSEVLSPVVGQPGPQHRRRRSYRHSR